MSNRVRRDDRDEDIPPCRETPEGRAVHDSPGDVGVSGSGNLIQRLENAAEAGEHLSNEELELLARDSAEALAANVDDGFTSMRFIPAEDIDEALDELFGGEYDHRHDGNAICPSCGGQFIKHYRFLLPCRATDIGKDDFVPVCEPSEDYFAFREDDGTLVVESPGGEQWEYCSYEPNTEDIHAECSRSVEHTIWNCKPLGKKDPVTEDYMRSIST